MNQQLQFYGVLVLVEAESGHLAREAVVGQMTEKMMTDSTEFSLPFLEPVQVGTDDGLALIDKYWQSYIEQGVQDVDIVLTEIADANVITIGDADAIEGQKKVLLESWAFRSACVRIGTIDSWPIRIYHLLIGINNRSILDTVINDEPGLWAVEVQLR
jgi:hypothetical protein